jgi:transposase
LRRSASARRPRVHLLFTATYALWLNQVELWFAKIEGDLLTRRILTSILDRARKIRRYIALQRKPNRSVGSTAIQRSE